MPKRALKAGLRHLAVTLGIGVVCMPAAFIVTLLLLPLWSWIEATYGIESVGHSGPADWCFEVVYVLLVALGFAGYKLVLWRNP
jgi:hypothetical protein